MSAQRVCLIVDNPLRDLDGLVLVAWQLARMGIDAWLVPMYGQAFDVWAIKADLVLANYVRFNNLEHLTAYRRKGIRLGILDTEGAGGKTPTEFAEIVKSSGGAHAVDLYCTWGSAQQKAFLDKAVTATDRIQVTGCPRYDYCASPWNDALVNPSENSGYVLINTNFPIINPRYSQGATEEIATAVNAGLSLEFAKNYVNDARLALAGILDLLDQLLKRWPNQRFILRPHPFESHDCYRQLEKHPNFAIRQEGTSVQWLSQARALLHLNCSTAVEAAMLGKPALSPAWLDTPSLNVSGPSSVSSLCNSPEELIEELGSVFEQTAPVNIPKITQILYPLYHHIDGHAAERVAKAIVSTLDREPNSVTRPRPRLKSQAIQLVRILLGYHLSEKLTSLIRSKKETHRRLGKLFEVEQVQALVTRLEKCEPQGPKVVVQAMDASNVDHPRLATMSSIKLSCSSI